MPVTLGGMERRRQVAAATGPGVVLLGQVAERLRTIDMPCNRDDRRRRLNSSRVLAEHGAYVPIPALLRFMAPDCPRDAGGGIPSRMRSTSAAVVAIEGVRGATACHLFILPSRGILILHFDK